MTTLHDYQNSNTPKFSVGDKVVLDCYGRKNKCTVREVNVTSHLFKTTDVIYYRVDGDADSICTAERMTSAA